MIMIVSALKHATSRNIIKNSFQILPNFQQNLATIFTMTVRF